MPGLSRISFNPQNRFPLSVCCLHAIAAVDAITKPLLSFILELEITLATT